MLIGTALTPEALFVPLELASLAAVLAHRRSSHRLRWALAAGALAGLAVLTRQNGAVMLLPLALAAWAGPPRRRLRAAAPALALLAAAALVVAPWTVRNALVLHAFVPVSTQGGYTLAGTYSPETDRATASPAAWMPPVGEAQRILRARGPLAEAPLGDELGRRARAYATGHPGYVAEVCARGLVRMAHLDGFAFARQSAQFLGIDRWLAVPGVVGFWMVGLLAVAGAALPPRGARPGRCGRSRC